MAEERDRLGLRISESALGRLLDRVRSDSGLESRQRYEFKTSSFSRVTASLDLRRLRLSLRASDAGAFRLAVSIRGEYSFGMGYPSRRIDLSCSVLATPAIAFGPEGEVTFSSDFAQAEIDDLRVRQSSRGGIMMGFDPSSLDPFAEDRLREIARVTLRLALRRLGAREGSFRSAVVETLLAATPTGDDLRLTVHDGEIEIDAAAENTPRPVQASRAASEGRTDGLLVLPDSVLNRVAADLIVSSTQSLPWQIESPRVRVHDREPQIEVEASVRPRLAYWPASWRLRLIGRLCPVLTEREIGLRLVDVGLARSVLPEWLHRRIVERVAGRVNERTWPRVFSMPTPGSGDEPWRLEISNIELGNGRAEVALATDL